MRTPTCDRIMLMTAMLIASGSMAWFELGADGLRESAVPANGFSTPGYVTASVKTFDGGVQSWRGPKAQQRGAEWIYDLFTPPEIFFDAEARRFQVTPPPAEAGEAKIPANVLELLEVKRSMFRLQLLGFVGAGSDYRGLFQNILTAEIFWATTGHVVPDLGLTIEMFAVRPTAVALPESMTTHQAIAIATVRDERTKGVIQLTSGERRLADELTAVVAFKDEAAPREVRENDTIKVDGVIHRIRRIGPSPPEIELVCESETTPQIVTLRQGELANGRTDLISR